MHAKSFSHVWLFVTLWTVAHQAPLSMIVQARMFKWVAMPSITESSCLGDQTCGSYISCIGR